MEKLDLIFLFVFTASVLGHAVELFLWHPRRPAAWVILLINFVMLSFLWGFYAG